MKIKVSNKDFLSPLHYSIFILDLPKLKMEELRHAVIFKLKGLYPGNIENLDLHIFNNGKKKNSYVIFLIDKEYSNSKLIISLLFIIKNLKTIGTKNICFINDIYKEVFFIKNFHIEKYNTDFSDNQINMEDCLIYNVSNNNTILLQDKKYTINDFFRSEKNKKILFFILFLGIISILFLSILFSYKTNASKILEQRKELQIKNEEQKKHNELQNRLNILIGEYNKIYENQHQKVINVIKCITSNLSDNTKIFNLEISNNIFFFEAISNDSLKILNNFENDSQLKKVLLHQVKKESQKEKYSISGELYNFLEEPPQNINLQEKIIWYEDKINFINIKNELIKSISTSSLCNYIRELINFYNGNLNTYQNLQDNNQNELEFVFSIDAKNLFTLLSILSSKEHLFNITKFSLRTTNYNNLNILIRISSTNNESQGYNYKEKVNVQNLSFDTNTSHISKYFLINNNSKNDKEIIKNVQKKVTSDIIENVPSNYILVSIMNANKDGKVYIKDAKTSQILKFSFNTTGNMSCFYNDKDELILNINNKLYRMKI
ncbi:MAG: hypothetical protein IJD23_01360 [Spirochaetaceae bacterium]|nr:hypothetical protein [Spirochaetaceae bacterium]